MADFTFYARDTVTVVVNVDDSAGADFDLTSATIRFYAQRVGTDTNTWSFVSGTDPELTISDAATGEITLDIAGGSASDTDLTPATYDYWVRVETSGGDTDVVKAGQFIVKESPF